MIGLGVIGPYQDMNSPGEPKEREWTVSVRTEKGSTHHRFPTKDEADVFVSENRTPGNRKRRSLRSRR